VQHCVGKADSQRLPATVTAIAPKDPKLDSFLTTYQHFFEDALRRTQIPGAAIAIVKGDSVLFLKGYGVRNTTTKDSVDTQTVFRIGSLSKGFASVLTGILVQKDLLHWQDQVQQYFPAFTLRDKQQAKRIQLWHLLSHTTGLPYHAFTNLIERGFDTRKIVCEYFPKAPVSGQEGDFYAYQNAAYCVIEEVMSGVTQQKYPQLLQTMVFQPAAMMHASCDYESMQTRSNKALPHVWTGYNWRSEPISPLYYNAAAAGGVNASIGDMAEWLKLLLGHKPHIVSDSTLQKVFTPVIKTGKERRVFPHWIGRDDAAYALGWRVLTHGTDTIVYHGGYVNGFRGEIAFNRASGFGICVLMNASSDLSSNCVPTFFEHWDAIMR
jgi:beta-lactamase class C